MWAQRIGRSGRVRQWDRGLSPSRGWGSAHSDAQIYACEYACGHTQTEGAFVWRGEGKRKAREMDFCLCEHSDQEDMWLIKPKIQQGKLFQNNSKSSRRTAGAFLCVTQIKEPHFCSWKSQIGSLCSYIEGVRVSHHQLKGSNTPTAPPILKPSSSSSRWRLSATLHSHTPHSQSGTLPFISLSADSQRWWVTNDEEWLSVCAGAALRC